MLDIKVQKYLFLFSMNGFHVFRDSVTGKIYRVPTAWFE